jgi:hypothetical protein
MYTPCSGEVVRLRGFGGDFYVTFVDCERGTADLIRLSGIPCFQERVPLGRILPRWREEAVEV